MERYFTIVFSVMRTTSVMSKKTCLAILLVVWLSSLCTSLMQLSFIDQEAQPPSKNYIIYDFICLGFLSVLPLVIMGVAYIHIFYTLRKHVERIKRDVSHLSSQCMQRNARKERKALLVYGAMICVFIVGWFNYFFNSLQENLGNRAGIPFWPDVILLFLRFTTGLLNPLLCTFLKQDFRRERKPIELFGWRKRTYRRSEFKSSLSTRKSYLSSVSSESLACEQVLVWVLCARCETREAKPRDERQSHKTSGEAARAWSEVGGARRRESLLLCNRDCFLIFRCPNFYMLTWIQNKDFHLRLPLR